MCPRMYEMTEWEQLFIHASVFYVYDSVKFSTEYSAKCLSKLFSPSFLHHFLHDWNPHAEEFLSSCPATNRSSLTHFLFILSCSMLFRLLQKTMSFAFSAYNAPDHNRLHKTWGKQSYHYNVQSFPVKYKLLCCIFPFLILSIAILPLKNQSKNSIKNQLWPIIPHWSHLHQWNSHSHIAWNQTKATYCLVKLCEVCSLSVTLSSIESMIVVERLLI